MGLFDKITKEPTEMDMVMENINRVEGEIQKRVYQLGLEYYEDHKEDMNIEEKYRNIVDFIYKLDLNKEGFYKNKLRLEGQMKCENCGALIPYGSMFCSVCGKRADEKQERTSDAVSSSPVVKCTKCGAILDENAMFCIACGAKRE